MAAARSDGELPSSPQIAVALGGPTTDDALRAYESIAGCAGIIELRLDLFTEHVDLRRLIASRPCPVVVTVRASVEGGNFNGSESERLGILRQAAALGADFVDVERFAFQDLGPVAPTRVIVSQHDFASMPVNLSSRWAEIRSLGADVVKVAGMAADPEICCPCSTYSPMPMFRRSPWRWVLPDMASRILALRYRCCVLTYASLDGDAGTAPGQIGLSEMHDVYHASRITPSTMVFGLIAPSVETELVATYNRLLGTESVDAVCVPLPTSQPSARLLRELSMAGFIGFHAHGPAQTALRTSIDTGEMRADSSQALNSVSVVEGQS